MLFRSVWIRNGQKEKDPKTGLKQLKQHYYSYDFSDDEQIKQFNKDIQKYKIAARANFS